MSDFIIAAVYFGIGYATCAFIYRTKSQSQNVTNRRRVTK